jgi:predicted P-loop ATPase
MSTIRDFIKKLSKKYDFKYNTVLAKTYMKPIGEDVEFKVIDEVMANSLYLKCKKEVRGLNKVDFHTALKSDICNPYNPFEDYFNNLPKWDGIDYIKELSNTVSVKRNYYWKKYFKKWIIGVVACALDEESTNHQALIFIGEQGVGKTTWLNKLLPKKLKDHLYMGIINNDKDTKIHLSECLLINIDEFETIGSKGLKQLKSVITQSHIRIRRPYDVNNQSLPRRASFMASVNDLKILVDPTGNRRFLIFEVTKINFNHKVDINMVYSQCLHLYENNFKYYLDHKDIIKINKINEDYRLRKYEEELLLKYFKPTKRGVGLILTTTEILQKINDKSKTFLNNTSLIILGKALSKNDFVKGRTKTKAHGWWVKDRGSKPKIKNDLD